MQGVSTSGLRLMEVTKGQKHTVRVTRYLLEAGGRDGLGKGRAVKIKGSRSCGRSLEITGKDLSIQVPGPASARVGKVRAVQSAVPVGGMAQALTLEGGRRLLSPNPRDLHPRVG